MCSRRRHTCNPSFRWIRSRWARWRDNPLACQPYSTSSSGSQFRSTTRIKHLKVTSAPQHLLIILKHSHLFNNSLRVMCCKIIAWFQPWRIQPNSSTYPTFSRCTQWFSSLNPLSRTTTISPIKPLEAVSQTQVLAWSRCSIQLLRQRHLSIRYLPSRYKMRDSRISRHPSKSQMRHNSLLLLLQSP